jgi:DNA-binding NarL/FixJ family response regulator
MNILIAANLGVYRFGFKKLIQNLWAEEAMVYEASNFQEIMENVYAQQFDLLVLDTEMFVKEQLESFISQAINHTRVIILSELDHSHERISKFLKIGADALLSKSSPQEQVINTLKFILS